MIDDKVNDMVRVKKLLVLSIAAMGLAACGGEEVNEQAVDEIEVADVALEISKKSGDPGLGGAIGTPNSPYRIDYRIVGTPIVGSPVTVDLTIESVRGLGPVDLNYRIKDASAMTLSESQLASVRMEPAANESAFKQQVTVIPQREGRFYLNVSASFETENGTQSTNTAIPIQVGSGSRELTPNGEVQLDENDELVRVLSSE